MSKPLRLPAVLAFTVLGAAAVAGIASSSCGGSSPTTDASSSCATFCAPITTGATCDVCTDASLCPPGCEPVV